MKAYSILFLSILFIACTSTKSTIKNVNDNAPIPKLKDKNTFIITEVSKDKKYGYDKDYPINVFFKSINNENINAQRFLNALAGPQGQVITYNKIETCCPFPCKKSNMGAGFLDVYEISWEGQNKPILLYINIYEKGDLLVPIGLTLKQ